MILETKNLGLKKSGKELLQGIDLQVPKNSFFVLLGPNGAGKTTLLKSICGLEPSVSGEIIVAGQPISSYDKLTLAKKITWIPVETSTPFAFSALDLTILSRYPWHQGQPSNRDHSIALAALDKIGLTKIKDQSVKSMSSGEKRKVMLARALASDAEVVILDEPLANLDPLASLQTVNILKQLCQEGKTIIASMHDLNHAYSAASHGGLIKNAKLDYQGNIEEVLTPEKVEDIFSIKSELIQREGQRPSLLITQS